MSIMRVIVEADRATASLDAMTGAATNAARAVSSVPAIHGSVGGSDDARAIDMTPALRQAAGLDGPANFFARGGKSGGGSTGAASPRSKPATSSVSAIEKEIASFLAMGGMVGDLLQNYVTLIKSGNESEANKLEPFIRQYGGDAIRKFPFGAVKKWFRPKRALPSQSGTRAGSVSIDQLMAQGRL